MKKIQDGRITSLDRAGIYITQMPQVFPRAMLLEVLEASEAPSYRDEVELWLLNGLPLSHVMGDSLNFKITEESDWNMACCIAQGQSETRTGMGYDVHPMVPGRRFVLGGVGVPSPLGEAGHSDGDILCHAVADAILSGAGLPDIGTLYPASDERYRGCDSTELLSDVLVRVRQSGWQVSWVSAVITAQIPRLSPWKDRITDSMSSALGGNVFSVTFKSGEKV